MSFLPRSNHVVHLTKQVHKEYRLVIQVLQSVHLLLVEVLHFVRSDDLVVIQINYREPVLQAPRCCLIFFGQHEPNKILITHFVFIIRLELPGDLFKDPIHGLPRKRMSFIPREVFFVDEEVMVSI